MPACVCCRLTKLVQNGPFPPAGETGARYIIRADGRRLDLKFLTKESDRHLEVRCPVPCLHHPQQQVKLPPGHAL